MNPTPPTRHKAYLPGLRQQQTHQQYGQYSTTAKTYQHRHADYTGAMSIKQSATSTNPKAGVSKQRRPTQAILNTNRKVQKRRECGSNTCFVGCIAAPGEKQPLPRGATIARDTRLETCTVYHAAPTASITLDLLSARCVFVSSPATRGGRAWVQTELCRNWKTGTCSYGGMCILLSLFL